MARQNDVCGHLDRPHAAKGMCHTCYTRAQYQANRDKVRAYNRAQYQLNAERRRELSRRVKHKKLPTPTRPAPNECEICGKACTYNTVLSLDHCHETQQFRGWLCSKCNRSLGCLGDNIAGLQRVTDYLVKSEGPLKIGENSFEVRW